MSALEDQRPNGHFTNSSSNRSFVASIIVHVLAYFAVVATSYYGPEARDPVDSVIEVGYEVLDEPPQTAQKERPLAKSPEKSEAPAESDNSAKPTEQELHDEKGPAPGTEKDKPTSSVPNGSGDGDATSTPYYKVKPKYPREALVSGIEGWVLLQIDITEEGLVENIRVLEGENTNTFQYEARRAVGKWRYRPTIGPDGSPVRVSDHKVKIEFKLEG